MQTLGCLAVDVLIDDFYENWQILKSVLQILTLDVQIKNQIAYRYAWIVMIKSHKFVNMISYNTEQAPRSIFSSDYKGRANFCTFRFTGEYIFQTSLPKSLKTYTGITFKSS